MKTYDLSGLWQLVPDAEKTMTRPEGEGVVIKYDDLSLSEKDMVKIVGRQYAAHAATASGRFCNIAKPSGT